MKKFFLYFVSFIILLLVIIYILLFTSFGNSIVKPIAEKKIYETSGLNVVIDKFILRFDYIDIEATIEKSLKAKIEGNFSVFSQNFSINYVVNAQEIPKIEGLKFDGTVYLNGKIDGNIKEFDLIGNGDAFGATIDFDTKIKNFMPINIIANVENLSVAKILVLLGQPIYTDGEISINANVIPNDENEVSGKIILNLNNGLVYEDIVKNKLNIILPKNTKYSLNANFDVKNSKDIIGKIEFISTIATLKTTKTIYDIKSAKTISDFKIHIDDLSKMGVLAVPLKGNMEIYGDVIYSKDDLKLNAFSNNFANGTLNATINNDQLTLKLSNAKIEEVLKIFIQPSFANGNIEISANLSSIKNMQGKATIALNNGIVNANTLKNEFGILLGQNIVFNTKINASIDNNKIKFDSKVLTNLVNLNRFTGDFDINTTNLNSEYILEIDDLSKFDTLTNQTLNGNISFFGNANYVNNMLHVSAKSDNFADGKFDFSFDGDRLVADINNAKVDQFLKMIGQNSFAKGNLHVKVDLLSIDTKSGDIFVNINKGELNENIMQKEFNITIPKITYSFNASAKLNNGLVNFNSNIFSTLVNVTNFSGIFDINKSKLDSIYSLSIDDLSKLNSITNQNMTGSISIDGIATLINDVLHVNGKSNFANGVLNFDLNDNKLVAKGKSLSTEKLLHMMNYPEVFVANVDANFNYDLIKKQGIFNATSPSGKLKQSTLGTLIKPLLKVDIAEEIYEILIDGSIDNQLIKFNMNMTSDNSYFKVINGQINNGNLKMPITIKISNRDLTATISGKSDDLKVTLDSSAYLKDKITEELMKEKTQEKIKKLLKKL